MRRAEPLAGLGGLLLLVALFLPWYGVGIDTVGSSGTETRSWLGSTTGWQALTVIDVLLALLAILAILVPIVSVAAKGPARPIAVAVIASATGWLGPLLVAIRLVFAPGDAALRYGAWLALIGAVLAWVGSWLSMRDDSTPGAVAPDVPRRPAPA